MKNEQKEFEAKFYLADLADLRLALIDREAVVIQKRTLEQNWRFDDLQGRLQAEDIVLRLRQDAQARLTYKRVLDSLEERLEIECVVEEAGKARLLLEALGYGVITSYEKYRETYQLEDTQIMLDELPFGCFAEIEGPDLDCVRTAAGRLGLDWERRVSRNYLGLFSLLKERKGWAFDDLSFDRFASLSPIHPDELDVVDARIR